MTAVKLVQPDCTSTIRTLLYSQNDVIEALGIKLGKNERAKVYCDGTNKVRIEIF